VFENKSQQGIQSNPRQPPAPWIPYCFIQTSRNDWLVAYDHLSLLRMSRHRHVIISPSWHEPKHIISSRLYLVAQIPASTQHQNQRYHFACAIFHLVVTDIMIAISVTAIDIGIFVHKPVFVSPLRGGPSVRSINTSGWTLKVSYLQRCGDICICQT